MPIPGHAGRARRPSIPSWVVAIPSPAARFSPSDAGSIPTNAAISSVEDVRMILIIRSVPMLPEPMIATLVRSAIAHSSPYWNDTSPSPPTAART